MARDNDVDRQTIYNIEHVGNVVKSGLSFQLWKAHPPKSAPVLRIEKQYRMGVVAGGVPITCQ